MLSIFLCYSLAFYQNRHYHSSSWKFVLYIRHIVLSILTGNFCYFFSAQALPPETVFVDPQSAQATQGASIESQSDLVEPPAQQVPLQRLPFNFGVPPNGGTFTSSTQIGSPTQAAVGNPSGSQLGSLSGTQLGSQTSFRAAGF